MLSSTQKEIVELPGNMIVRASAGTGKTHTMVSKIMYDIALQHTHKSVAAITFTIKAANEIKERLKMDTSNHFIGTNNSFVIEEIIKPFMKDAYGPAYKIDMSTDYSKKFRTYLEGLDKIKHEHILCSYEDNKKNFIFQLALDILKKSKACKLYLQAKYFKIYIDEYQDCDRDMHALFMYICKALKIDTFVVGDEKQSIYMWRGAYPKAFLEIWDIRDFSKRVLSDNFRSCQQIQNYSNLLCDETRKLYKPTKDLSPVVIVCATSDNWVSAVTSCLDPNMSCALLRYKNADAEAGAKALTEQGSIEFTYVPQPPIADITTESAWLYNAIAKFFILPKYSIYDFRDEIPSAAADDRKILSYIKKATNDLNISLDNGYDLDFEIQIMEMEEYFGYDTNLENYKKLYETICNRKYHPAFDMEQLQRIAITFHSSKGLEFDQVILFASDYPLSQEDEIYNHYVAATRAKSKLIIVYIKGNDDARKYADNINNILKKSGLIMRDIATVKDY